MANQNQFGKKVIGLTNKDKWTQRIVWAGLIGTGLYFWDMILPFLIRLTTNSIHLVAALAVLGGIVWVLTDPKLRILAKTYYYKTIQNLTRIMVKHDPIGVMRVYIQQLKVKYAEMDENANEIAGEKGKVDRLISDQFEEMQKEISMSKKATTMGEKGEAMVHQNQAGRLKSSNDKLKNMSNRMAKLQHFLKKLAKNTDLMIQDKENSLRSKEVEYNTLKAGHKALSNATAIFNGKGGQKEMYEEALKFLQDDMGMKMGQMDRYLEQSQDFMLKMDIESAIYDEEGAKLMDDMLEQDFTYLFEDPEDSFQKIASGEVSADDLLNNSSAEPQLVKTKKSKTISKSNASNPYA